MDTKIKMYIPENISQAEIQIFSFEGRIIESIPVYERGNTTFEINRGTIENGIYIYSLFVDGNFVLSRRMVLRK